MNAPIVHDPGVGRRKMLLSGVRGVGFDERAVLRELGELGWRDGECFAAVKTIAQRMGGTVYRIRKALHSLIGQGLLVAEDRTRRDGSNASRRYRIVWSEVERRQDPQLQLWREQTPGARSAPALPARRCLSRPVRRGPLRDPKGVESGVLRQSAGNNDNGAMNASCPSERPATTTPPGASSLARLIGEGFRKADAMALAAHGEQAIRNAIDAADAQGSRLRNRRGFLSAAIRGGWDPPERVVLERQRRERATTNAALVAREQDRRLAEMREFDRRNAEQRAAVDRHARALGDRFAAALAEALPGAPSAMRDYIERRLARGDDPSSIDAAASLVWQAAQPPEPPAIEQPPPTCKEIADHGEEAHPRRRTQRSHDHRRRADHGAGPQADQAHEEGGEAQGQGWSTREGAERGDHGPGRGRGDLVGAGRRP